MKERKGIREGKGEDDVFTWETPEKDEKKRKGKERKGKREEKERELERTISR